tara:strand:+ start:31 stop:681 length:651 start_codon:yes stop_codon:yes gene_type:complete
MRSTTSKIQKNSNTPDTINISLHGNNDSVSGNENNNNTVDYIIELNKELLQKNQDLISQVAYLEKELQNKDDQLEEKDDELGLTEKSNQNYKSVLKNFAEETKNYKELYEIQEQISLDNYKHIKEFKYKQLNELRYSVLAFYSFIIIFSMGFYNLYTVGLMIIYSLSAIGVVEFYIWNFTLPLHEINIPIIKEKKQEIKKIEEGLGYIYKFIDDAI